MRIELEGDFKIITKSQDDLVLARLLSAYEKLSLDKKRKLTIAAEKIADADDALRDLRVGTD